MKLTQGLVIAMTLFTSFAYGSVWETGSTTDSQGHKHLRQWTDVAGINQVSGLSYTWEDRYSDWIREEVDENFFAGPNSLYQGKLDCAEAAYTIRLLFAFTNALPFRAAGGSITNETSNFDAIKSPREKLRRFIDYVKQHVNTNTLSDDTYSVRITRDYVRPGVINLLLKTSSQSANDSQTVKDVSDEGVVTVIKQTVQNFSDPRRFVNGVDSYLMFLNEGFASFPDFKTKKDGLRAWRHSNASPVVEAGFDDKDQFNSDEFPASTEWGEAIRDRLAIKGEGPDAKVYRLAKEVCNYTGLRLTAVNTALEYRERELSRHPGGECMNPAAYKEYSTGTRDGRFLLGRFSILENYLNGLKGSKKYAVIKDRKDMIFDQCIVFYDSKDGSHKLALQDFENAILAATDSDDPRDPRSHVGNVSSNPNDSLKLRWGIPNDDGNFDQPGADSAGKPCPTYAD